MNTIDFGSFWPKREKYDACMYDGSLQSFSNIIDRLSYIYKRYLVENKSALKFGLSIASVNELYFNREKDFVDLWKIYYGHIPIINTQMDHAFIEPYDYVIIKESDIFVIDGDLFRFVFK